LNTCNNNYEGESNLPLQHFKNIHKDEMCLLLGNGPSLAEIPLEFLQKNITIGANTIFKGFTPNYYTAVDTRVFVEFREEVDRMSSIKFFPSPKLEMWIGEDTYFWDHKEVEMPGNLETGINYHCIMHVQMQIADYMGFSKILTVIDHSVDNREKFWGVDEAQPGIGKIDKWAEGYKKIREGIGAEMYNIAPLTRLPDRIIPWMPL